MKSLGPLSQSLGLQRLLSRPKNWSSRGLERSVSQILFDVIYLKIRRGIYELVIKASKLYGLNCDSREEEILKVLSQETKHDAEFDVCSLVKSSDRIKTLAFSLSLSFKNQFHPMDANLRSSSTSLETFLPLTEEII